MKVHGLLRKDTDMENPTKQGNYTTIFADGSIVYENPWLMFSDGHGKWYWNEKCRGGIVAWNEIPEGGYKFHRWYKLPEHELKELVMSQLTLEALEEAGVRNWPGYSTAFKNYCDHYYAECIEQMAENEMKDGYYAGYEVT